MRHGRPKGNVVVAIASMSGGWNEFTAARKDRVDSELGEESCLVDLHHGC